MLVDLPGIGETPQHDQEYRTLYRQLLPDLDLIIWILRADERAYAADIAMHQFLLNEGADPSRFLFVLSHADRVFPAEEWNTTEKCPSRHQELSLATVTARVATLFPSSFPVLPVAAPAGWNLPALVSLMIHALPSQATSAVYSHIWRENRSEQARKLAQQTFGDAIGKSFDDAVARFSFPVWMLQLLRKARETLFTGTINRTEVHPREVIKRALYHNAAAVVLAHNHPSGEVTPSKADRLITERLVQALALVDIRVPDHLIVGGSQVFSFAEHGLL